MILSVVFSVKNHIEVFESWPIQAGDTTFFLERDENVLKSVGVSFRGVAMDHAPTFRVGGGEGVSASLHVGGSAQVALARRSVESFQAILAGIQILEIDYDGYELKFVGETPEEEALIPVKSFKSGWDRSDLIDCDFEHIGRAFCAEPLSDKQIESISHFREGRVAFEAGRYVDAYNNAYLFLETRYCDGKTKTAQQVEYLHQTADFVAALEEAELGLKRFRRPEGREVFSLFEGLSELKDKIKAVVNLRGKLRHHSLKSPQRWDPLKQDAHRADAHFLLAVVQNIVLKETLAALYKPEAVERFRKASVETGNESKVNVASNRLEKGPALELSISVPTTHISSRLCLSVLRTTVDACRKGGQLDDTVRLDAITERDRLELFQVELGVWAYTETREAKLNPDAPSLLCAFEKGQSGRLMRSEFSLPNGGPSLSIGDCWYRLMWCLEHIENRDPTARVTSLKFLPTGGKRPLVTYRVGANVTP